MIKFLRIRNLATIEDLEVRLDGGFSILTGETGAGKSIIIGSSSATKHRRTSFGPG
jgi:DNA repair protein RecN (Recombination protein N)